MRALSVLVALPTLQACIIPQHVQIDPPDNFAPSIADPLAGASAPIGSHVSLADLEPGDAGLPTSIRFEVSVRDPDVDQRLEYLVFLNRRENTASVDGLRFLPADAQSEVDRTSRLLGFDVAIGAIADCARVELFVSSGFVREGFNPDPQIEGDLAVATWWIVRDRTVPIERCAEAP